MLVYANVKTRKIIIYFVNSVNTRHKLDFDVCSSIKFYDGVFYIIIKYARTLKYICEKGTLYKTKGT